MQWHLTGNSKINMSNRAHTISCEHMSTFGFHKNHGFFAGEWLLAAQEWLCSMNLFILLGS